MMLCRDVGESNSRALDMQADLQALQADHARLSEQCDTAQACNASLRHDLKICQRSLKQVRIHLQVAVVTLKVSLFPKC